MSRLVMKFGGTSVADMERIRNVARHVKREVDAGHQVAVVVSAMAGVTNQLVAWCRDAAVLHDARVRCRGVLGRAGNGWSIRDRAGGDGRECAVLAGLAIAECDDQCSSWSARRRVNGAELVRRFEERQEVAVVAGFQGVGPGHWPHHHAGRGGSDTRRSLAQPRSRRRAATCMPTLTGSHQRPGRAAGRGGSIG